MLLLVLLAALQLGLETRARTVLDSAATSLATFDTLPQYESVIFYLFITFAVS